MQAGRLKVEEIRNAQVRSNDNYPENVVEIPFTTVHYEPPIALLLLSPPPVPSGLLLMFMPIFLSPVLRPSEYRATIRTSQYQPKS